MWGVCSCTSVRVCGWRVWLEIMGGDVCGNVYVGGCVSAMVYALGVGGVGSVWVCIVYVWVEVGVGAKLHKYVCLGLFVFSRLCLLMCNVHMLT
jgi:hypothetical protein